MSLRVQTWQGEEISEVFEELAHLRIQVFKEYPYLYLGSFEYEKKYLTRYSDSELSFLIGIWDGKELIGASTAMPLMDEEDFIQKPFLANKWELKKIFYFGESLLLAKYRGQGFGNLFFDSRESFAFKNNFSVTTFCSVIRPETHALKPAHYRPHDLFWNKRGYQKHPELLTQFEWQDIDQDHESKKQMQFWVKQ